MQLQHAKKQAMVKLVINSKKKFSQEKVATWLEGEQFAVMEVDGNPTNAVAVIQGGPGATELAQTKETFKNEIFQMLGVDPRAVGDVAKLTQSGSQKVPLSTPAKHDDRKRCVERFIGNVMGKLSGVAQQVSNETEIPLDDGSFADVIKTSPDILSTQQAGEEGQGQQPPIPFIKIDEKLLSGDFSFKFEVGSTRGTDERMEEEKMKMLVEVVKDNPSIDKTQLTKLLLERLQLNEYSTRLFRDPKEVAEEQEQNFQRQLQLAMAEPQLKTSTDLQKTQMKTESAENVAEITAMGKDIDSIRKDERERKRDEERVDVEVLKVLQGGREKKQEDK